MSGLLTVRAFLIVGAVMAAASCSSSSGGSSSRASGGRTGTAAPTAASRERRAARGNAVFDLASMLSGTFEGASPGNEVRVTLTGAGVQNTALATNVAVTITGKYQGTNVSRQQGVLHVESRGDGAFIAYVPHFDPAVGTVGLGALRFTPEELDAACSFTVKAEGDGYAGETVGSTTCVRALRGAVGKWTIQIEPGSIRLRNVESGETLRFRRTGN